jgi:hypothetical protein
MLFISFCAFVVNIDGTRAGIHKIGVRQGRFPALTRRANNRRIGCGENGENAKQNILQATIKPDINGSFLKKTAAFYKTEKREIKLYHWISDTIEVFLGAAYRLTGRTLYGKKFSAQKPVPTHMKVAAWVLLCLILAIPIGIIMAINN